MSKEEAISFLQTTVDSFNEHLDKDGQVLDPVFQLPMQYGTPYHALCRATLGLMVKDAELANYYLDQAATGLQTSINEILDPDLTPNPSGYNPEDLSLGSMNHRDFYWPAILQAWRILKAKDHSLATQLGRRIKDARVPDVFKNMPPSNWAAVWLSGEYMRYREKLSPYSLSMSDRWLGTFFKTHVDLNLGFYKEPGHPNSYDLFTRYHFASMLVNGYKGQHYEVMHELLVKGLKRSLAVQLSDGSLASAYRSTGMTWTLGCQIAYFTLADKFLKNEEPDLAKEARKAASLAYQSFTRFMRKKDTYSPVENCLPSAQRVGYERYTFDANYSNLAMGFLSVALLHGFQTKPVKIKKRSSETYIEGQPVYRALAHESHYSAHFNAYPHPYYDAYGLVDLTFGPGRYLHFAQSVKDIKTGKFYNVGKALRSEKGIGGVQPICQQDLRVIEGIQTGDEKASFKVSAHGNGTHFIYNYALHIDDEGVHITEATEGNSGWKSLVVPFLKDAGTGDRTEVTVDKSKKSTHITFSLGKESIGLEVKGEVARAIETETGYTGRRGWHAMLRIDFGMPTEAIDYRFYRIR